MNGIMINRNIDLIAAEINNIKDQTKKQVIFNSIEIGRRLVEAKAIIEHGEWGNWLAKSVSYSQSTANNLVKIFNEYGADQMTLLNDNSKSQALGNLSYTQAVALLGIPSEEREEFVQVNDIEAMSTRELQKAIKEKQQLEEELAGAKEAASKAMNEKLDVESKLRTNRDVLKDAQKDYKALEIALEREKKSSKESIYNLQKSIIKANEELDNAKASGDDEEVTRLQASLQESQNDLDSSAKRIDELEAQLKTNTIDVITAEPMVIEKIPEETQKELEQLRKNISGRSIARFRVCFEDLQETFREQLELMPEIKKSDPIIYEKCKGKMLELINSMAERL